MSRIRPFDRHLRNVTLSRLVVLALGSMLIVSVLIAATGVLTLRSVGRSFDSSSNEVIADSLAINSLRGALLVAEETAGGYVDTFDVTVADYRKAVQGVDRAFRSLLPLDTARQEDLYAGAVTAWEDAQGAARPALAGEKGAAQDSKNYPLDAFHDLMGRANAGVDELALEMLREVEGKAGAAGERARAQTLIVVAVLAIALFAAGAFARVFRKLVQGPLRNLREAASQFGMDNLAHRVAIDRGDELGDVADAFNSMASRLLDGRQQLLHQAFHDSLTGLPNRALLLDRAEHAITRAKRRGETVAVIYVGVDDFKRINDSLGHSGGDEVLIEVAGRLRRTIRAEDTVARLGGDEFAVLLEDIDKSGHGVEEAAGRILSALDKPLVRSGAETVISASLGIYVGDADRDSAEELLHRADVAMYAAKEEGKHQYREFEMSMHEAVSERALLETELAGAQERGELDIYVQPIISLKTGRPVAAEALLRWHHPKLGMIPPDRFIPIAEKSGRIIPIGQMVIERAAALGSELRRSHPELGALQISVNLSMRQLQHPSFVDEVELALRDAGCEPGGLIFEITESMLAADVERTVAILGRLKELGVAIAVDDFGTGYSSLAYLNRFPIDTLKIDKTFIDGVGSSVAEESALARSIIKLAQQLRLATVAEGIEHPDQVERLKELGCDSGQGFLYSRPVPVNELMEKLGALGRTPFHEAV